MGDTPLKPCQPIPAAFFNDRAGAIRRQDRVGFAPGGLSNTAGGRTLENYQPREWTWIRITAVASDTAPGDKPAHAWEEVIPGPAGAWTTTGCQRLSGTTTNGPAYEINGLTAPVGTVVRAWFGWVAASGSTVHREMLFRFCCGEGDGSSGSGSGSGSGSVGLVSCAFATCVRLYPRTLYADYLATYPLMCNMTVHPGPSCISTTEWPYTGSQAFTDTLTYDEAESLPDNPVWLGPCNEITDVAVGTGASVPCSDCCSTGVLQWRVRLSCNLSGFTIAALVLNCGSHNWFYCGGGPAASPNSCDPLLITFPTGLFKSSTLCGPTVNICGANPSPIGLADEFVVYE